MRTVQQSRRSDREIERERERERDSVEVRLLACDRQRKTLNKLPLHAKTLLPTPFPIGFV
jgi:hypothetical protein